MALSRVFVLQYRNYAGPIFAAAFFAVVIGIGAQERTPNTTPPANPKDRSAVGKLDAAKKTGTTKQASPSEPQIMPCNQTSPCYVVEEPEAQSKEERAKQESLDTLYRRYMWATIFGVVGAFIGLGILIWQTIISRNTANAAKVSAQAALLNAQAVISAERPWLVVQPGIDDSFPGFRFFKCLNQGNTPAKLISFTARHEFVRKPDSLAIPPVYTGTMRFPETNLIVHQDSFQLVPGGIKIASITENHERAIQTSSEFLMIYGSVIYRDTLHPETSTEGLHETRWCFAYSPAHTVFVRSGPEEYNRYT